MNQRERYKMKIGIAIKSSKNFVAEHKIFYEKIVKIVTEI